MIRIVLIGNGNVAFHLHRAFLQRDQIDLVQLAGRRKGAFEGFDPNIPRALIDEELAPADLYIVAVSDNALTEVVQKLKAPGSLVVHTSGAFNQNELNLPHLNGVFYPLQTFTKRRLLDYSDIPFFIEADQPKNLKLLEKLVNSIGGKPVFSSPKSRLGAHLAAVFTNNFTNHMIFLGREICKKYKLDPDLLRPLVAETFLKLREIDPRDAQTGPARRGDQNTWKKHQNELESGLPLELYNLISNSIKNTYRDEL